MAIAAHECDSAPGDDLVIDTDQPLHRAILIAALREAGFETAREMTSGGGIWHVEVPLVETEAERIAVATTSAANPCDVQIMGERGDLQFTTALAGVEGYRTAGTLTEAVDAFAHFAAAAPAWLPRIRAGEFNT